MTLSGSQQIQCINGHCFEEFKCDERYLEINLYTNSCKSLQEYISNIFCNEHSEDIVCPLESKVVSCKYINVLDSIPKVLILHIDKDYYCDGSLESVRIPFDLEVNPEILLGPSLYEFKCALLHCGSKLSGHFKVIIKYQNDFYIYSDAIIEKIEDFQFSNYNEGYDLLMYIQRE